jgi:predicted ATPase with chaperone activity
VCRCGLEEILRQGGGKAMLSARLPGILPPLEPGRARFRWRIRGSLFLDELPEFNGIM